MREYHTSPFGTSPINTRADYKCGFAASLPSYNKSPMVVAKKSIDINVNQQTPCTPTRSFTGGFFSNRDITLSPTRARMTNDATSMSYNDASRSAEKVRNRCSVTIS